MRTFTRMFMMFVLSMLVVVPSFAQAEPLQVLASHSILADVVTQVAGDAADVVTLIPGGADPHSFQPTPSDLTALADADVVFINGAFFEEGLLEGIENASDDMNIVTASSCVQIIAFGGHADEASDEHEDEDHEEGEEHDHEEDEEHEHEDEDHKEGEDHDHEEHKGELSAMATLCEQHNDEMAAFYEVDHEEGDEHAHEEDEAEDEHDHEEDEAEDEHDHEEDEVEDEHAHEEGEEHEQHIETLGALYEADCGEGHGHEGEGEEEANEEDGEHAHGHGVCDPHVWMEPHNVMYWTMLIRDTLIELDPANTETYNDNASTYLATVDALIQDFMVPMVETVAEENRVLVTNHDAFGYFAANYDFEIVGSIIPSLSTLSEPSAGDIAEVIDLINEQDIPAIFAETTVSDDLVQQVAEETGVPVTVLYSGSLSDANGPASTYLDYIRYNITTIVEALGGGM